MLPVAPLVCANLCRNTTKCMTTLVGTNCPPVSVAGKGPRQSRLVGQYCVWLLVTQLLLLRKTFRVMFEKLFTAVQLIVLSIVS